MRNAVLIGLVGAWFTGLAAAGGCGGGGEGGSGATTTTASTSTTTTTTHTTSATGGSGGSGGIGNHSFETAIPVDLGTTADGDLATAGAKDYYSFEGKAGQAVVITTQAQGPNEAADDPTTIDTVVTLYDANKNPIAENNDRYPRRDGDSQLFTRLPADGTYYIRVVDCWTWESTSKSCFGTAFKQVTAYSLSVAELDPTQAGTIADTETGNDAASAADVTFEKGDNGYYLSVLYGDFVDNSDVDVYRVKFPSDAFATDPTRRPIVTVYTLPSGKNGDGSPAAPGRVYLADAADPATRIAMVLTGIFSGAARLWPPVDPTHEYLIFIEHPFTPGGVAGVRDFYFMLEGQGLSNAVEKDEAGNDAIAGAEKPTNNSDVNGDHYYIDGDLINGATDVDHWEVPVGANTEIAVSCSAQSGGSGLNGFMIDVIEPAAATTVTTVPEAVNGGAWTGWQPIPPNTANLVVKLSAKSQAPNVTGTFYHCGIHLR